MPKQKNVSWWDEWLLGSLLYSISSYTTQITSPVHSFQKCYSKQRHSTVFQDFQKFILLEEIYRILHTVHICVCFKTFQGILQGSTLIQHSSNLNTHSIISWFPENSTEYQLIFFKHSTNFHSSKKRKGDVALSANCDYTQYRDPQHVDKQSTVSHMAVKWLKDYMSVNFSINTVISSHVWSVSRTLEWLSQVWESH